MRRVIVVLVAAVAILGWGCEEVVQRPPRRTSNDDVLPCLPGNEEVRGLTLTVEPKRIERGQLGQHLRAEATLYLAYGVDHMASARYENTLTQAEPEQRYVQVDVFRMRNPTAAYGLYTCQSHVLEPPTADASIGAEARLGGLSSHLWEADCYVKAETGDRTADGRTMMRQVLEHVARHIVGDSPRPEVLDAAPTTLPGAGRPRLFTDKVTLGTIHWVSDQDVLALGNADVQGLVIDTVDNAFFFVVRYPSARTAERGWAVYSRFLEAADATKQGPLLVAKLGDDGHAAAFALGTYVAGVWAAPTARSATDIAMKGYHHIRGLVPAEEPAPATAEAP